VFPELSTRTAFNPLTVDQGADHAKGIYDAMMLAQSYGVPILVTENGAADPDDNGHGSQFLVEHLTWLSRAIRDGADVRGYLWWTLTDNIEWNHGMDIRMGLYAVAKDDPFKARLARQTVGTFKRIADGNVIPSDLLGRHPVATVP
jgi:beta-glucosidase/6-phospho-beta-glucosidase/beta-galactosidase